MLGFIFRIILAILDWRTMLRFIQRKSIVDVVFISNLRDDTDSKRYVGKKFKDRSFLTINRYWLENRIASRLILLNTTTEELLTSAGRRKAREQFLHAVDWAKMKGVKVVLFAAGTKRLFRREELIEKYPDIVFSIGDNGTSQLLINDTLKYLNHYNLKQNNSRIAVLAPYGFLGEEITKALSNMGYNLIGAGPNFSGIKRIKEAYNIDVCESFEEMGKVDAVISCTHSEKIRLTAEKTSLINRNGNKLLFLDVAEPANLTEEEHSNCKNDIIRLDAGNGNCKNLKAVFGLVSWKILRLGKGGLFGCFTESYCLAASLYDGYRADEILSRDWFIVNDENMSLINDLFKKYSFTTQNPKSFGNEVKLPKTLRNNQIVENILRESELVSFA